MKSKIEKFLRVYFETFLKSRLLTQLFLFPTAIIAFLCFFDLLYFVNTYDRELSPELWADVRTDLVGLSATGTLLASRFLLLFSKRELLFGISQLLWLATLLTIYWQIPPPLPGVTLCVEYWLAQYGRFTGLFLLAYLFFSPLRQALTLIISIRRVFDKP